MPYKVKKKKCKMKSGEQGQAVRYRKITHGDGGVTLRKVACHKSVPSAHAAIGKIHDSDSAQGEVISEAHVVLRGVVTQILKEELTPADKREIEKISRRQAQREIDRALRDDLKDAIREEVTRALGSKATRDEIADIAGAVLRRLHREIAAGSK